ncbi:uncharacterized protein LOC127795839 isoform X2 [Diospyros lotus]|uniref:uncharacterized protein LOC127795839 isoform X2 n=1 Tax=Diospyros lotus TaxID=55363 RepID=UPI00224E6209|nr:uncharacterized protein LOC127795839 isoform X2 [Diospyros lotus]
MKSIRFDLQPTQFLPSCPCTKKEQQSLSEQQKASLLISPGPSFCLIIQDIVLFNGGNSFANHMFSVCLCGGGGETARMKKSPVHLRYEAGNYGFDPKLDFSQFLEEARKHASEEKPEGAAQPEEGKKKRKSWKRSLFPWWKSEQKSNSSREAPARSHSSKSRYGNVSAPSPIRESGGAGATGKPRRPTSGPLTGLFQFHPTKRVENEMPYLCLDKLTTDPYDVHSYGPVYLVT